MSDGSFLLSIAGQIEWIDILASAGSAWYCKYEFVTGPDWKIVGGLEAGLSQTANVVVNGAKIVLNIPIDIVYKSSNPFGCYYIKYIGKNRDYELNVHNPRWKVSLCHETLPTSMKCIIFSLGPQIVISVYNGIHLKGYGRIHLPLQPGPHRLYISLSKPQASSLLGYLGTFFGYQPELLQPKMLATTAGNNLIRMVSSGEVKCSVNILSQNLSALGYDVGNINRI